MKIGIILKTIIASMVLAVSLTASLPSMAMDLSSDHSEDDTLTPVRLCGSIYRYNEHGQSSADNVVKIAIAGRISSSDPIIIGQDQETATTLEAIRWPNHVYIGCVYGNNLPQQGIEGMIFTAHKIELLGQPTGFSVGN